MRRGPSSQSVISTVSAEVKVFDEQDHISRLDTKLRGLWSTLREQLLQLEGTSLATSNGYISVKSDAGTVCFVHFRKNHIRIEITRGNKKSTGELSKRFFTLDDPKQFSRENSWTWKSGETGHQYILALTAGEELDYAMYLIEQKLKAMSS